MPKQVQHWYVNMSPQGKLKFASLCALMGEEKVASYLVDTPDIDELFARVADHVYRQVV